ncbi:trypsin-like peptidase domain-containing protein [Tundrisphaera lichenicola]|uniref:trypsin-like peptidase domain-containing protein n=1 Tax=Tundrisphaera lichenicola TaxID=2029860 RepID=UPI003EB8216A
MPLPNKRLEGFWPGVALAVLALSLVDRPASADLASRETPVTRAVRKVKPSVVNISSEKKAASTSRWPFSSEESQRPRVSGMGSGVIVDGRGFILTNHHVVDKVQGIEVHLFDGTNLPARVIQSDREMDLAVLKVDAGRPLTAVAIGASSDLMEGETVITIGNAFGYENTVSQGIISSLKRNVTLADDQVYRNLIQTDACINPGNSGGPLINIDGELVGINVATRSGAQGIGFALPIDEVKRVASEMMSTRRLALKWHGMVAGESFQGEVRRVVLSEVQANSPAEEAGFRPGDHVVRIGELPVTNTLDIERALLDAQPGSPTRVLVRRDGKDQELPLDVRPLGRTTTSVTNPDATQLVWRTLGLKVTPVDSGYVAAADRQLNGGLYVESVVADSPAGRASILRGDILVGLNVGTRNLETLRPDNVLYILRQPGVAHSMVLPYYIVRSNRVLQGSMTLAEANLSSAVLNR